MGCRRSFISWGIAEMARPLWPRLGSPRYWQRTTRRLFILFLPVSLPGWMIALLLKNALIALDYVGQFLWKFWNDPPKRRMHYYTEIPPHERRRHAKVTIERGKGERVFEA